jgi:hypothetical protein
VSRKLAKNVTLFLPFKVDFVIFLELFLESKKEQDWDWLWTAALSNEWSSLVL